jgi:diaminopimelate decarboxylase
MFMTAKNAALEKPLPFAPDLLQEIAEEYGTPVFVYDDAGIRENARRVNAAYGWNRYYTNFFAVKATPTPGILRVIADEGMGFDCSSRPELLMVQQENLDSSGVFYSSNNTPDDDYRLASSMRAVVNVDKLPYVEQVYRAHGNRMPDHMAIRYNPGSVKSGNDIIGDPMKSKFGDTEEHVLTALTQMRDLGAKEIGLHTMVVSNEKDPEYFRDTARLVRELADKAMDKLGIAVDFINVGGGMGVNYHPAEKPVDVEGIGQAVGDELGDLGIPVYTEHGRYITGPNGYLLTGVTHGIVESYEPYLQIDTSVNNMARLATVKAAYHHINILGRDGDERSPMNIVGSMCANTDKMFVNRELPKTVRPGDLVVVHDAGAHSRANSHNYNFRLRCGEVLVHPDGTHTKIRRHETVKDLFATTEGL